MAECPHGIPLHEACPECMPGLEAAPPQPTDEQIADLRAQLEQVTKERDRTRAGLAALYAEHYACIGKLCDEYIDRSGKLLGEIRDESAALTDKDKRNG